MDEWTVGEIVVVECYGGQHDNIGFDWVERVGSTQVRLVSGLRFMAGSHREYGEADRFGWRSISRRLEHYEADRHMAMAERQAANIRHIRLVSERTAVRKLAGDMLATATAEQVAELRSLLERLQSA